MANMKVFEFMLIINDVDDQQANAVYGKCPDASLGSSHGKTYVAFDRESESLEAAIQSAIHDLQNVGVQPLRVEMEVPQVSV